MRLFDQRARDNGSVLQHILEVDKVAVVHMLGKIVRVVEVDNARLVCLDDVLRQQDAARDVLGNLACHVVALYGVDGRVLICVLLLDFLVVRLNQAEDTVIRGVGFANERTGIAVGDIALCDLKRAVRHDLILDEILNLLDGQAAVHLLTLDLHALGDALDLQRRHAFALLGHVVGLTDRSFDFFNVKNGLCAISLNDFHSFSPFLHAVLSVHLQAFKSYYTISCANFKRETPDFLNFFFRLWGFPFR